MSFCRRSSARGTAGDERRLIVGSGEVRELAEVVSRFGPSI